MENQALPDDFKEFLRLLNDHEVDYLLIGGYAVGYPFLSGRLGIIIYRQNDYFRASGKRNYSASKSFCLFDPVLLALLWFLHILWLKISPVRFGCSSFVYDHRNHNIKCRSNSTSCPEPSFASYLMPEKHLCCFSALSA